jgi:hypothetical protein
MTLQAPSTYPKELRPAIHDTDAREPARFVEGSGKFLAALEVSVPAAIDRAAELRRVLLQLRVQVVGHESRLDGDRVVHGFRVVEFDGAPLERARRVEVLSALRPLVD